MIKSMTGFGTVSVENDAFSLSVEVKSLNSKSSDIYIKMSSQFSDKEIDLRNLLGRTLERGKINLSINFANKRDASERMVVNRPLVVEYYRDLKETADLVGASHADLFRMATQMPDAYIPAPPTPAGTEQWALIYQAVEQAIAACEEFRVQEGQALATMLHECLGKIEASLAGIAQRDPERIAHIRQRLHEQVRDYVDSEQFDANRFEQELIYYTDKLDINEEKVRLRNHLTYFVETMNEGQPSGKKLNFIAQEIGREINTIGSKANDATIQRLVVNMKEELEKIKEQLNNVL
jgi:uncharacterized protein (TIGR00255 family)